ncbi:UNVERIFIED_CONTAM: hypothetical protein RMT77_018603 [Armadillidium vulgare]
MKGIFGIVIIAFVALAFTEGGCLRGAKSSSRNAPPETAPIEGIAQSLEDSVLESPAVPIPNDEALQRRKRSVKDASEDTIESLSLKNDAIPAEALVGKTKMSSSKFELPSALIPIHRTLQRSGRSVEYTFSLELPTDAANSQSSGLDPRIAVMPINEGSQISEKLVEDAIANETPIALAEPLDSSIESRAVPNNEALQRRERSVKDATETDASEDTFESLSWENDAIAAEATVQKTEMSSSKFDLPPALIPIHRILQRSGRSVEYTFSLELPTDAAETQSSGLDPRIAVMPINKISQISEKAVEDAIANEAPIALTEPLDSVFESPSVPISNSEALQRRERSVKDASEDIIESLSWENDAIPAEALVGKTEMSSSKFELPPALIPIQRTLQRNGRSVEYTFSLELPSDSTKTQSSGLDSLAAQRPINEVSQISEKLVEDAIANETPIALAEPLDSAIESRAVPNNEALQRSEISV